jgi:hypothetical protein
MAITTLDGYIASMKQKLAWSKTAARVTVANTWFSLFDIAGQPGAGVLAGGQTVGSTTAGIVPTDATPGYPMINAFSGANKGYLGRVEFASTVACRIALFDRLWCGGAYAFNAAQTLAAQPSFSSRVPGGTDYTGLELWLEAVTAFTGVQSVAVTYTNESGVAAKTTGTIATAVAPTVGRCLQLPLASGDSGIQKIETVTSTVSTVGTFNVSVLRPLWSGRVIAANMGDVHDMIRTGLYEVFADSALYAMIATDAVASGVPECSFQIVNG